MRPAASSIWLGAACIATLAARASAQQRVWVPQFVPGPEARYQHAMTFDSWRGVTVLYGGMDQDARPLGDTWEWDGVAWTLRDVDGPGASDSPVLAFDTRRGVTVLLKGRTVGETWEWDGAAWERRDVAGPSARYFSAMAYDAGRGVCVLFAGWSGLGGGMRLGDTWEWDGSQWAQRANSGPRPRVSHAMAYDTVRGVTVMNGGWSGTAPEDDTWEWDGSGWSRLSAYFPASRFGHGMAFDGNRGVVVLFGGVNYSAPNGMLERLGDTWERHGTTWERTIRDWPTGRSDIALAHDTTRGITVMFGGYAHGGPENQTWEYRTPCPYAEILAVPADVLLEPGQTASFVVEASGATEYHWRRDFIDLVDGERVSGSASPALTITGVQASDEGLYDCLVRSPCNGAVSAAASLDCHPVITVQPPSAQHLQTGLRLMVGSPGVTNEYHWFRNGAALEDSPGVYRGSRTPTLELLTDDEVVLGAYEVVLSNACGSTTSHASFVLPPCYYDANADGNLDQDDLLHYLGAIFGEGSVPFDPDINQDGNLDQDDIAAMVEVLAGGRCP